MISSWLISSCCLWIWTFCIGVNAPIHNNPNHALYLSITDMEIDEGKADFKIKVFSDDLRDALKSFRPSEYKPADMDSYFALNQELANSYFGEHFLLWAGGKKLVLQVKGATIENDAHFISFNCSIPQNLKELKVQADFFMELFPTQTNVVKVKSGAQVQYLKFTMPVVPQSLSF